MTKSPRSRPKTVFINYDAIIEFLFFCDTFFVFYCVKILELSVYFSNFTNLWDLSRLAFKIYHLRLTGRVLSLINYYFWFLHKWSSGRTGDLRPASIKTGRLKIKGSFQYILNTEQNDFPYTFKIYFLQAHWDWETLIKEVAFTISKELFFHHYRMEFN